MFVRTFVAVDSTDEIQIAVGSIIREMSAWNLDIKWVEAEQLHITVAFLGEIELRDTHDVCRETIAAASEQPAFQVAMRGVGAFPSAEKPRTLWIGLGEGLAALTALHESLLRRLISRGFRPDTRRFAPHLTIGRVKGDRHDPRLTEWLKAHGDFDAGWLPVDELIVYSSDLQQDGPEYTPLGRGALSPD